MKCKIFFSYRREDAKSEAGRIYDHLKRAFGRDHIFMDVDNLRAGQRFEEELNRAISQCDILLAVIGKRWMKILSEKARSDERDYVHEEIAASIERRITVIPVLVDGASLPSQMDLPESIRDLVSHQKHNITHERFGRDVEDLTAAIKALRKARTRKSRGGYLLRRSFFALILLGLVGGGIYLSRPWINGDAASVAGETTRQAIETRVDSLLMQFDYALSWSEKQAELEAHVGGTCGVASEWGPGPLYRARSSVGRSMASLRETLEKSWIKPVQSDLEKMRVSAASEIPWHTASIATRTNLFGEKVITETDLLADALLIKPDQPSFSCYDPTLAQLLRQVAAEAERLRRAVNKAVQLPLQTN